VSRLILLVAVAPLAGCAGEELLHGLEEREANEVLVALDEGGIPAEATRAGDSGGGTGGFTVAVPAREAARARRLLSDRSLPRPRASGFDEALAEGSMVPSPAEERARFQHAVAGELSRSLEALDGVVSARVHLALPEPDPLRPGERPPPRAGVLLRCRPAACAAVRGLEPGVRALVAGAADGLDPAAVAVVVAEAAEAPAPPPAGPRRSWALLSLAAVAAVGAAGVGCAGIFARRRRGVA
jgi:type III secretion protein J